jgi:hypothetical protein
MYIEQDSVVDSVTMVTLGVVIHVLSNTQVTQKVCRELVFEIGKDVFQYSYLKHDCTV